MKQLYLFLLAVTLSLAANAQLKADAGTDKVWCLGNGTTTGPTLGGPLVADQGTPPYSYEWTTIYTTYGAQLFLDSITSNHPKLVSATLPRVDSVFFQLRVTDANNQMAFDTVRVYLSRWICPLAENVIYKASADTVTLRATECKSSFGPNDFLYWTPGLYLADSTDRNSRCWTPVTQYYKGLLVNQVGCQIETWCYVEVNPTGIPKGPLVADEIAIYPNPLTAQSKIVCSNDWLGGRVNILSVDGKLIQSITLSARESNLSVMNAESAGVYFYQAISPKGKISSGRFLKE